MERDKMSKNNVMVLRINDGHDAGAALVQDGQVIAAVHEERLNNIKGFEAYPKRLFRRFLKFRIGNRLI